MHISEHKFSFMECVLYFPQNTSHIHTDREKPVRNEHNKDAHEYAPGKEWTEYALLLLYWCYLINREGSYNVL